MDERKRLPTYDVEFVPIERRHDRRRTHSDRRSAGTESNADDAGSNRRKSPSDRRRMARRVTDLIGHSAAPANPRNGK